MNSSSRPKMREQGAHTRHRAGTSVTSQDMPVTRELGPVQIQTGDSPPLSRTAAYSRLCPNRAALPVGFKFYEWICYSIITNLNSENDEWILKVIKVLKIYSDSLADGYCIRYFHKSKYANLFQNHFSRTKSWTEMCPAPLGYSKCSSTSWAVVGRTFNPSCSSYVLRPSFWATLKPN